MAERFYVNCPLQPGPVELRGPEAHHLAVVCRVRPGDQVRLFNGDGREYPACVTQVSRRGIILDVFGIEAPQRELGFRLEVAAPLPKGDRAQFLVEKLTELGVTSFVPLRTQRSVVHPRETRLDRLERYVIEASKQCGRNVLLRVGPLTDWEDYCRRSDLPAVRVLAHPSGEARPWPAGQDAALAVGPEGGFTDEEVEQARSAGWLVVGLGPRILRVETAALVLAIRSGEW
ncbi:MAG TPA: RsmE family RNA methyltransferase [Gemmataceae bacterium]|nr:RsmE family RNA methyltransferase [Gemmataceae bacterium]